jgi:two-component system response regulator
MEEAPLIVLIDDDGNDEELARLALHRSHIPHRLEVLRDGAEALDWLFCREAFAQRERAREAAPRLILLDLKLPKVNGLEVLEQIRRHEPTRHLPVVVFTSSAEDRDLSESYRRGANAYIRKPVDFREYKELIVDVGSFWIRRNQMPIVRGDGGQPT